MLTPVHLEGKVKSQTSALAKDSRDIFQKVVFTFRSSRINNKGDIRPL